MTKQEFIERQRRMNGVMRAWSLFYTVGALAFVFISAGFEAYALAVLPLFMVPALFWVIAWNEKKIGVRCPHCMKSLWAKNSQIPIATGNCGHCGEKVLCDA